MSSATITAFLNADTNGVVTFIIENPILGATIMRSSRETGDAVPFIGDEHAPRLDVTADVYALNLRVDPSSGVITLENNTPLDLDIDGYRISSSAGSLDSTAWNSLGNLGYDSNAWSELDTSANALSEGSFGTSSVLGIGSSINLGAAYDTAVSAADLVFEIHLAGQAPEDFLIGDVNYLTDAADFDNDGDVDGIDFLAWQRGFSLTGGHSKSDGDANGDGFVNAADLTIWESEFGLPSSPNEAAATAVPEPAGLVLAASAVLFGLVSRRRL